MEHGNLRELALDRMADLNLKCRDIRTREVGITEIHKQVRPNNVEPVRRDYYANGGWETFLSYEDPEQDILIGLCRLRLCTDPYRPELQGRCSIVRELHVYGTAVPVHSRDAHKFQHQGYGQLLMEWAARIAEEEHESEKIAVISGVGTRDYYRKLGYELDGPYMSKKLNPKFTKFEVVELPPRMENDTDNDVSVTLSTSVESSVEKLYYTPFVNGNTNEKFYLIEDEEVSVEEFQRDVLPSLNVHTERCYCSKDCNEPRIYYTKKLN